MSLNQLVRKGRQKQSDQPVNKDQIAGLFFLGGGAADRAGVNVYAALTRTTSILLLLLHNTDDPLIQYWNELDDDCTERCFVDQKP